MARRGKANISEGICKAHADKLSYARAKKIAQRIRRKDEDRASEFPCKVGGRVHWHVGNNY
jgi:hypothetical protein